MSSDTLDKTIHVLNDLIKTSKAGEKGFRTCAQDVQNPELKNLFDNRARECATAAHELQSMVFGLGGKFEGNTSLLGVLHRAWVNLKSLMTGKGEKAILNECERGEDVAKRRYSSALGKELPLNVRALVQRQYVGVVRNYDQIKALRNKAHMRG